MRVIVNIVGILSLQSSGLAWAIMVCPKALLRCAEEVATLAHEEVSPLTNVLPDPCILVSSPFVLPKDQETRKSYS